MINKLKEEENKIDYLIGQLNGSQTDVLIKEELKELLISQQHKLLQSIVEMVEDEKEKYPKVLSKTETEMAINWANPAVVEALEEFKSKLLELDNRK